MTTVSCCRHPDREILHKRSAYRDLAQVVLYWGDLDTDILRNTPILHKCSSGSCWGDLKHLAQEILIQRSCTRGPKGPWCKDPDTEICARDPHTVILHKWSYRRILVQRCWKRDLGQETRIQRSCTSGPRGCWCRNPDKTSCRSGTTGFWCRDPDTGVDPRFPTKKAPQHCLGSLAGIICFQLYVGWILVEKYIKYVEVLSFQQQGCWL